MPHKRTLNVNALSQAASPTVNSWIVPLAIALFLITRGYILFVLEPQNSDTQNTYFAYAMKAYDGQLPPYSDFIKIEYPPLAWWVIYLPRLFVPGHIYDPQIPEQFDPVSKAYAAFFRGLMSLCDLGSFILLAIIANKRRPTLIGWALLTYTLTTAILGHLLFDRLDIGLLLLLMCWAACSIQLMEHEPGIGWSVAAYFLLGLSIGFKIIPVICVPFLLLSDCRGQQRLLRLTTGLAVLALAMGLPFVIQYAISGPDVFYLLKYHEERGIQIESLYSTFMMIGAALGRSVLVVRPYGTFELLGDLSKLMIALSNVLLFAFLAGTWLWTFFRRADYQDAYRAACFVLVGSVIVSKVLSPQYFVWAIPISMLLALELLQRGRFAPWGFSLALIAVVGLTTWIFPYHYVSEPGKSGLLPIGPAEASNLNTLPCIILGMRNALYLAVVIWLGLKLFSRVATRSKVPPQAK